MRRITFEAKTLEELVELVQHWVGADQHLTVPAAPSAHENLEEVLARIHSSASRQFLRELAARALSDQALVIDDGLRMRGGLPPGRSFVGVLGVANRTMRRRAGRELISWDPRAGGYRVSAEDARTILATYGPPSSDAPALAQPAEAGEGYH